MSTEEMLQVKGMMEEVVAPIKTEIADMKTDITGIKGEIADLDERVTRIGVYQETIITRSIDALAEGHDIIREKMRELASQEDLEEIRDDISVLKTVVGLHSREIEALKKAQ